MLRAEERKRERARLMKAYRDDYLRRVAAAESRDQEGRRPPARNDTPDRHRFDFRRFLSFTFHNSVSRIFEVCQTIKLNIGAVAHRRGEGEDQGRPGEDVLHLQAEDRRAIQGSSMRR